MSRHPDQDYHAASWLVRFPNPLAIGTFMAVGEPDYLLAGFMLLEELDGAFGRTVQTLEVMGSDWPIAPFNSRSILAALSLRFPVSRRS